MDGPVFLISIQRVEFLEEEFVLQYRLFYLLMKKKKSGEIEFPYNCSISREFHVRVYIHIL